VLPVAFAPSLWAATLRTLRELTRVAVTALVLVVGFNGLAAAPASAAPASASAASIVRPASAVSGPSAAEVRLATPAAEVTAGQPRPASVSPVPGVPPRHVDHDIAAPAATTVVVPAADPGRASIARRGPPHA